MYDEQAIKQIITRAFEIQNEASHADRSTPSGAELSMEEIEQVARESGLSTEYVRQAALELEGIPNDEPLLLDTGNNYEVELLGFAKGQMDSKAWAEVRSMLEYHFDTPGKILRRPDGIKWKAQPRGIFKFMEFQKSPTVEIESSANKTTIRIKQNLKTYNKLQYPAYAALALAIFILGITADQNSEIIPVILAIAGSLGVSKLFFNWCKKKKKQAKERLKDLMIHFQTIITRRYSASTEQQSSQKEIFMEPDDLKSDPQQEAAFDKSVKTKSH